MTGHHDKYRGGPNRPGGRQSVEGYTYARDLDEALSVLKQAKGGNSNRRSMAKPKLAKFSWDKDPDHQ